MHDSFIYSISLIEVGGQGHDDCNINNNIKGHQKN